MTFTSLKLSLFAVALACLVPVPALLANDLPQGDTKQKQMQMPKDQVAPAEKKSLREDPSNPIALIKTNYGDIYVELFPKEAPKTVGNWLQ